MTVRLRILLGLTVLVLGLSTRAANAAPVVCLVAPGTTTCSRAVPTFLVTTTSEPVEFSLEMWVTGAAGYDEFFVDGLQWNASILDLVSIELGTASRAFLTPPVILTGALQLTAATFATDDSGQLTVLNFRTVAPGETTLTFVDEFGVAVFQGPQGAFDFAEQVTGATVRVVLQQQVPEPVTGALLLTGVALSALRRRRLLPREQSV